MSVCVIYIMYFVVAGSTRSVSQSDSQSDNLAPEHESPPPHPNLYTVRVYRSSQQTTGDRMALIIVSLFQRIFLNVSWGGYNITLF